MNRHLKFISAGLVSIGACALVVGPALGQATPADQTQPQQEQVQPQPQLEHERDRGVFDVGRLPGVAPDADLLPVGPMEANNIRGTLAAATEAAMTRGQLRSVAQRLTTSDERRLHDFVRQDHAQLDNLIDQLQQAWQQRYNERFNIGDRAAAYPAEIVQIRLGLTQQALTQRYGEQAQMARAAERPQPQAHDGITARPDVTDRPELREQPDRDTTARVEGQIGDVEGEARVGVRDDVRTPREADAQVAAARDGVAAHSNTVTVIFPARGGLPEVHVPLINEGTVTDAWRIDVPLHIDGQTVHDNLVRYMNKSLAQQEQWPADVNEAYRTATHLVVAALLDVKDTEGAGHMDPPAGTPRIEDQPNR